MRYVSLVAVVLVASIGNGQRSRWSIVSARRLTAMEPMANASVNSTNLNVTAPTVSVYSTDLTAIYYAHANRGAIVEPLVLPEDATLPDAIQKRLDGFGLSFDELDGYLQRALLWDEGYVLQTSTNSADGGGGGGGNASSSSSRWVKIYTRDGASMASLALTRMEIEGAGCEAQICSTLEYGAVWRAVRCKSPEGLLDIVQCAVNVADMGDSDLSGASAEEQGRPPTESWSWAQSVWAIRNEDYPVENAEAASLGLAVPDISIQSHAWVMGHGGSPVRAYLPMYAIHTRPPEDEPALGQCSSVFTDSEGYLSETLTIPCAAISGDEVPATARSGSKSRSKSGAGADGKTTSGNRVLLAAQDSSAGTVWGEPETSELLTEWLTAVAPQPEPPTAPASPISKPSTTPSSGDPNPDNSVIPDRASGDPSSGSSRGDFDLLNLVPILVGSLAFIAVVFGFIMFRRKNSQSKHNDGDELETHLHGPSSMFRTEDETYSAHLSPSVHTAAYSGGYGYGGGGGGGGAEDPPFMGRAAAATATTATTGSTRSWTSSGRRRPKSSSKPGLTRNTSEPHSSDSMSRISLDTDYIRVLETDPYLSSSRLTYDKIVFERVLSRDPRYETWLCQFEGEELAVKRMASSLTDQGDVELHAVERFINEIQLTASLEHPNIARFMGVAWSSHQPTESLCLASEYQPLGDLRRYMQKHRDALTWSGHKLQWATGIAHGMSYLHAQKPIVLHYDLHSLHVLLSDRLEPKLIEYGRQMGRDIEEWTAQLRISESSGPSSLGSDGNPSMDQHNIFPYWVAPEALRGERYRSASDVYSLGMLLSELDTCRVPYLDAVHPGTGESLKPFQLLNMVVTGRMRPELSSSCPRDVRELIRQCLDSDPSRRPSMKAAAHMLQVAEYSGIL